MRIIAYYLPQYHPIHENDQWWGKNFTEWVNVRNAKPLFKDHQQPVIPGELGYYNLLDTKVRERQAQLAREAGVEGFCYWHYWFGGKQLLEQPLLQVLANGQPDFPFCIAWANESWYAKTWVDKKGESDRLLIEQTYSEQDDRAHFEAILPMLRDKRYILVDGKPLLVIYRPLQLPDGKAWVDRWQQMAHEAGLPGLYLVGHTLYRKEANAVLGIGFDAVNIVPIGDVKRNLRLALRHLPTLLRYLSGNAPLVYDYAEAMKTFDSKKIQREDVIPTLLPNWDHSPRSSVRALVLNNATPQAFRTHVQAVCKTIEGKKNQLVMLKSWNEWSEGNYIEPDSRWNRQFLEVLKDENNLR